MRQELDGDADAGALLLGQPHLAIGAGAQGLEEGVAGHAARHGPCGSDVRGGLRFGAVAGHLADGPRLGRVGGGLVRGALGPVGGGVGRLGGGFPGRVVRLQDGALLGGRRAGAVGAGRGVGLELGVLVGRRGGRRGWRLRLGAGTRLEFGSLVPVRRHRRTVNSHRCGAQDREGETTVSLPRVERVSIKGGGFRTSGGRKARRSPSAYLRHSLHSASNSGLTLFASPLSSCSSFFSWSSILPSA